MITFLDMTNEILVELNEVLLTSITFGNATNIQKAIQNFINKAYFEICTAHYGWPFLALTNSQEPFFGNTYVETVAGTRWYLLNPNRRTQDDDYSYVSWDRFYATTKGVSGEVAPYSSNRLRFVDHDFWMRYFKDGDDADLNSSTFTGGVPRFVIRNPDNIRFGLSPVPDKVYRIYFYAYSQPQKMTVYSDYLPIPDRYIPVVLARARYYAWQYKENYQQAGFAADDYKKGLRQMREELVESPPDFFSDDRMLIY